MPHSAPVETGTGGGDSEHAGAALLPEGFHFGVATAGYQIEGGYNGPGEPANNWCRWEAEGRVEPSGSAIGFWERYEEYLDLAAGLGCDSFRMSIEWARAEPEDGALDEAAIDGYRRILDACRARGMMPLVTLHHFTHPAWLGEDFWLGSDAPDRFAGWVRTAVDAFGDLCANWITTNELNVLALESFVTGTFPPGRLGRVRTAATALDHLVTAHVLAYDVIHDLQPHAVVGTNNYCLSIYEFDRLPLDLLLARPNGISRPDLGRWLQARRQEHESTTPGPQGLHRPLEAALRALAARTVPADRALPRATQAVYESPRHRHLDVAQVDFYAPGAADHLRCPGRRTAGGRTFNPARDLWDDRPDPTRLTQALHEVADGDLKVWLVENGMCNRVRHGRSYTRLDGWTRDRYLREHLAAVVDAIDQGVPVNGYWHWTLADNYEWGSYQPRFGLYHIDRDRGLVIGRCDAMGVDAAGTYRRVIAGLRRGDRSVLVS